MTKSYKMLVLLGMLQEACLPGEIAIGALTRAVERIARRSPHLVADIGDPINSPPSLGRHLEQNPIAAWAGGRGTGAHRFFTYEEGIFRTTFDLGEGSEELFQELARELAEFRLAEYLRRPNAVPGGDAAFRCRVSHSGGTPILRLPDRKKAPAVPEGWTSVVADGHTYQANFVKVAINVMRRSGSEENVLSTLLRGWFGEQAGSPGTREDVEFSYETGEWVARPLALLDRQLDLWSSYPRKGVAERFGMEYSRYWEQGFVPRGQHTFLFVTLDKSSLPEEHRYGDRFLDRDLFEWQSQNKTRRETPTGEKLRKHSEEGIHIHLLIRKESKIDGRGAPFVYCGEVDFVDWEGDKPITIRWRLREPVPDSHWAVFAPAE